MKEMRFNVEIQASKHMVWNTLWQDDTFRDWAGVIDPGTYMVGELKAGNEVQFISAENGYGVTSFVEDAVDDEHLLLKHLADTQDAGIEHRENEWTGGKESYVLSEKDGTTTLTMVVDVPESMEEYFRGTYPKAFGRVKELAESRNDR